MDTPSDTTQWFYLKNGNQHGPLDGADLAALIQSGALPADTPVFNDAQTQWLPASATGAFPLKAAGALATLGGWRIAAGVVLLLLAFGVGHFFVPAKTPEIAVPKPEQKIAAKKDGDKDDKLIFKVAPDPAKPGPVVEGEKNELNEKIAKYDEQIAQAKIDLLEAQNRLAEIQKYNTKLQAQIRNLQVPKPDPQLAAQLTETEEARRQLLKRLDAANLHNAKLRAQITGLLVAQEKFADPKILAAQLEEMTAELDTANQKISSLEQQLKGLQTQAPKRTKRPNPQKEIRRAIPTAPANGVPNQLAQVPANPQPLGQVSNVDPATQIIVINRGSDQGIKSGDQLRLISRATGQFLGQLTIRRVRPTLAVGTLNGPGINRLKPGDLLYR